MKVHRNWWRVAAMAALALTGIDVRDAGAQYGQYGQYAPYGGAPQTQVSYGYPTTGQPAVTSAAPQGQASAPQAAVQPQVQAQIPTAQAAPGQPTYMAYRTQPAAAPAGPAVTAQLPTTPAGTPAALPYQPQQYSSAAAAATPSRYGTTAQIPTYPSAQSTPVAVPAYPSASALPATTVPVATVPATTIPANAVPATAAPAAAYPSYTVTTYPATAYPSTASAAAGYPTGTFPAAPAYPAGTYPSYPQVARRSKSDGQNAEAIPAPVPSANGGAAKASPPAAVHAVPPPTPAAGATNGSGYPSTLYPSANGCNTCATPSSCGYPEYGINGYFEQDCGNTWFGGVYFLWMERDNASPVKAAVMVDHAAVAEPYYPPADTTVLAAGDYDFRAGVEVRFGSTFTIGENCDSGCNTGCGYGNACGGCSPPPEQFAWEAAWWGIDDDTKWNTYVDWNPGDTTRLYGMRNFVGLQYDRDGDGLDWRPVNDYYGYGLPIEDPGAPMDGDLIILAQRVRTDFWAQNLELNLVRFPVCNVGCGGGNSCGTDPCGCEKDCFPISFSMCGMCGVRYFRTNDDFFYASEFGEWSGGAYDQGGYDGFTMDNSNELYYDIQIDNHLLGPQVGWYMNYCVASKWNFFCNSTFGIFNNHINHYQRLWSNGGGTVRHAGTGEEFRVRSDKNDVAFLGELRVGGAYDITCNWRGVLAYRAVAITGVATSSDQFPTDFTNREYVQIIDSDASMVVHGLQAGFECRY